IQSLHVDGKPVEFKTQERAQVVHIESEIPVREDSLSIDLTFIPTVEILPFVPESKTGDSNKGLKIISLNKEGSRLVLEVEGLSNETYEVQVTMPEDIAQVEGAELKNDRLIITMPEGEIRQFVLLKIVVHLKN
ncbi:MAG: hypothetical protein OEY18_19000, partial [Candidatus Aminicenantes bacterium]|nr:hypothetical protein [Candidatus Aminicenantes bacterium]